MDSKERRLRQRLKTDFAFYAEKCLHIRTKQGRVQKLRLNTAQQFVHARLQEQLAETGRVRALILKGRQQGCSTYVAARHYWLTTHRRGARAFILTHLEDASKNIYQMMRRFHDNCPAPLRPHTTLSNSRELLFDRLDSGYHIGTARSSGVGRSQTLQFFHGSEVAFWPQAEEHVAGILQAVPDAEGTEIILESTSAGAEGMFHALCRAAMAGESEYRLIFVPWFWQEEYRSPLPADFCATAEEMEYRARYFLQDEQIYWRRRKIQELNGVSAFRREYPATAEEAFETSRIGALWTRETINRNRRHKTEVPALRRVVVAIDPAVSAGPLSDETGIIVAGICAAGHAYILEDLSGRLKPADWAARALSAYYRHRADRIVAEVNQGGDMVEHTIRSMDPAAGFRGVHASRGKIARAEPVSVMDGRGMIHHAGHFPALEAQMFAFDPLTDKKSPDRVDARVWAITDLMLDRPRAGTPAIWTG